VELTPAELRRRLKAYYAEDARVKTLRRQILDAAKADDNARFEFFCRHG
jgi:hypothetical protein